MDSKSGRVRKKKKNRRGLKKARTRSHYGVLPNSNWNTEGGGVSQRLESYQFSPNEGQPVLSQGDGIWNVYQNEIGNEGWLDCLL